MPNNFIKIWESDPIGRTKSDADDIELQNQIRILYHRLKERENNQVFIIDAYNYYKGISKIRPNISFGLRPPEGIERNI